MRTSRLKAALGGACVVFALATIATSCTPPAVVPAADAGAPGLVASGVPSGDPSASPSAGPSTDASTRPTGDPSALPSTDASTSSSAAGSSAADLPYPAHVVIVVLENHSPRSLQKSAPYLTSLAEQGASFTNATALRHPSEPNYFVLFSGSTHGVTDDSCPHTFSGPDLASTLRDADETFAGYAEAMPRDGYTGCSRGRYARKHNPWVNFSDVPAAENLTFDRFPQGHFKDLPTVSFVIPDLCNDMHDCSVGTGDAWLKASLSAYVTWAKKHNSVLIITADESESPASVNRVPLILVGAGVRPGVYDEAVTHLSLLRTIEDMYGLPCLAKSCKAAPITDIWKRRPGKN